MQLSQNEWYHPPPCDPNLLKSCLFSVHNCWRERKQIVQILCAATPFRKVTNWMTFYSWTETFPPACNIAYPTTIDTHCPNCYTKEILDIFCYVYQTDSVRLRHFFNLMWPSPLSEEAWSHQPKGEEGPPDRRLRSHKKTAFRYFLLCLPNRFRQVKTLF